MSEHVFDPATNRCECGTTMVQFEQGQKTICPINRVLPAGDRPRPVSFDAVPEEIGNRVREIRAEEALAAGRTPPLCTSCG